jgi:hypothetical protein
MADKGKIIGKEIFSVGEWNGDEYTLKDLEEMVITYNETSKNYKPYMKLGHDNKQMLLQNDGLPSAGWVENLRIIGKKLVCDIVDIPEKIYKLITENAYRYVSSEIFWNISFEGKKYPKMLSGVALLGSDMPAVTNLNDFANLYTFDYASVKSYNFINNSKTEDTSVDFKKQIEDNMPNIDQVHVPTIIGEGKKEDKKEFKPGDEIGKPVEAPKMPMVEPKSEIEVEVEAKPEPKIEDPKKEELAVPTIEELQAQIAELQKQLADAQEAAKMACDKSAKFEMDAKEREVENFIALNKVAPAAALYVKELLRDEKKEYSINDKKMSKSELISEVIKVYNSANVNLVESSSAVTEVSTEIDPELATIKKFAEDRQIDFNKNAAQAYKLYFSEKSVESEETDEE